MFVLTMYHPDDSQRHPDVTHWRDFDNAMKWALTWMSNFEWEDEEEPTFEPGVEFHALDCDGGSVSIYPIEAMEDRDRLLDEILPWYVGV